MLNYKTLLVGTVAVLSAMTASAKKDVVSPAQEQAYNLGYYPQPYWFVQAQGGIGTTFTSGKNFFDLTTPSYSIGVGRMFSPVVGARLHVNGYEQKGALNSIDATYKYRYLNTNLDVMFNITNFFYKTNYNLFNTYLVLGAGLSYAWHNDDFRELATTYPMFIEEDITNQWGEGTTRKSLLGHSVRAGLLFDFNVAKHWSVGAEFDISNLSDRFNSKYSNSNDWMFTAQASVTYKFGFKKAVRPVKEPVYATRIDTTWYDEVSYKAVPIDANSENGIKFEIRQSDPTGAPELATVAQFVKEHKDCKVHVTGYADKGTGNPRINMKYSKARAERVTQALVEAGVPVENIITEWKGDTVQPFPNNDDNRVAIIVVDGIGEKQEKVITKKFRTKEVRYQVPED